MQFNDMKPEEWYIAEMKDKGDSWLFRLTEINSGGVAVAKYINLRNNYTGDGILFSSYHAKTIAQAPFELVNKYFPLEHQNSEKYEIY